MNKKFWKNKKVLITGHTGFKGSWLSFWLNLFGSKVYGLALAPEKKSLFNSIKIKKILKQNIYCDINNINLLKKKIRLINPDIVFHLASQPLVIESYKKPLETIRTNVLGTCNLLNILRKCKRTKAVIVITSDKCYKTDKSKKFRETDSLGGHDIYSASKACAEIVTSSYRSSFFCNDTLQIATARSGNVIGGGDYSKNRLIPDIIKAYEKKKICMIRNPNHIRPWQHVFDPLYGYILLAENLFTYKKKIFSSAWNFGPNKNNYKVIDVIKHVNKFLKIRTKISKKKYYETFHLKLNSNKAYKYLKWKTNLNFQDAIKVTLEWYLNSNNKSNLINISKNQIYSYLKYAKK